MHLNLRNVLAVVAGFFYHLNAMAGTEEDIARYKQSWTAKALALQRQIDMNAPFNQTMFVGTHNSYNSKSYQILPIRYVDPNHTLSVYDQLELGVRSIEFDAHWFLGRHMQKDILLCHGQDNHLGCSSFDRPISEGLEELRNWLNKNPNEIVLLYIERHLDGHEPRLAYLLDKYVGDFIFKPVQLRKNDRLKNCISIPSTLTKAEILRSGKQLLIVVKSCDGRDASYEEQGQYPYIWNDYVFAGIGSILGDPHTFIDTTIGDDFKPYPRCETEAFNQDPAHTSLWRMFEDRTRLSNATKKTRKLLASDMQEILRCDIHWPAMDMLEVNDDRLTAAVWSWATTFPIEGSGQCAIYKKDEGIQNKPCSDMISGYVCENTITHHFKSIAVMGAWDQGEAMCQSVAGRAWHFSMPVNGSQMHVLKIDVNRKALPEVWLNYRQNDQTLWQVMPA